jgi:uncharacterized protein YfaP (DUF2135 family)
VVFFDYIDANFTGVLTKNLWGPYVFPPTMPTAIPTRTLIPTLATPTEQTLGTGDVQVTLRWVGKNDLDLHVIDPAGEEIYYQYRSSQSGGNLDVDSNAGCSTNVTEQSVENIFWPLGDAPTGTYQISVVYYQQCIEQASTSFTVQVLVDGQVKEFAGQVDAQNDKKSVYEFSR